MEFMVSNFCEEERGTVFSSSRENQTGGSVLLCRRSDDSERENRLPPEMELGNIEYKAKLVSPTNSRLEHLITQMKWRLSEGLGEAIYELGVEDDGKMVGLSDEELDASLLTLRAMTDALAADIVEVTEREVDLSLENHQGGRRRVAEILIRRVPESQPFIDTRLAMLGGADVGKSTLCGVLTHQALDDGHGKTRLNQFRYLHEVQTGKTSSVCLDIVAFDSKGKILNYTTSSVTEMVEKATKVVHLIDLAGDAKYQRTTIYGLSAYTPHACCLMVSAVSGPTTQTKEHLGLAVAFSLPVLVVVTKRDAVDEARLKQAASQLTCASAKVPLLCVSSVTGQGLRPLRSLLNALSPAGANRRADLARKEPLFTVEEYYRVPHVGEVVCGVLCEGELRMRERVVIGPSREGVWREATIGSIRRSKVPVQCVRPGEAVSLSLNPSDNKNEPLALRRGMIVRSLSAARLCYTRWTASLLLLTHSGIAITHGFQATFFIGAVRQAARVESIEDEEGKQCAEKGKLRMGECKTATLRTRPVLLQMTTTFDFTGKKILVTGASKGIGRSIALSLARAGAEVVAFARDREALDNLAGEAAPSVIRPVVGDVSSDAEELSTLLEKHHPFHGLVNNAGIGICQSVDEFTQDVLERTMAVNFRGPVLLAQIVSREMRRNHIKGASIVNVSSQAGLRPLRNHLVYSASKAALDMAGRVLALELGAYGIRVNSVNPTVVLTDMGKANWSDPVKAKALLDQMPLGRFAEEMEVVNSVLFLLSNASSMTTGHCVPVDGGFTTC